MRAALARPGFLLTVLIVAGTAQAAEPKYGTGRYFEAACKAALDDKDNSEVFRQGECVGMLQATSFVSEQLSQNLRFCSPGTVTGNELVKVLLAYMDKNPKEIDEPLVQIGIRAFRINWPCR